MTLLQIQDLRKNLSGKPILKGVNLTVRKGEIMGVVGPSGSGKSTLLRCINRLIDPDHGSITYNNTNYTDIPPVELRREILLVHQESVMLPGTVFDNVAYGPSLQGDYEKKHLISCVEHAGLPTSFIEKNASKLSGGEKKRVAVARALALNPTILLLDEPTSGVDPKNVQKVERNIVSFARDLGLTVLWVTHYVEQATRVSNRIANLKDGVVKTVEKTADFQWEGAY